jgi:tetratricopeptide (TPR) repeat protein
MLKLYSIAFVLLLLVACQSKNKMQIVAYKPVSSFQLSDENQRKFDFFFYEANKEKLLGNVDKAVSYYIECLRIDSTSSVSLYELANFYSSSKQFPKAIELMQRAVRFNPLNSWYQLTLADLYHQTNNFPKAIAIYEQLVRLNSDNDDYLFTLSQLYAQNNQFDLALKSLNQLESRVGFNETIILEKMKIYIHLNKEKQSYVEVEKLIKKFPGQVQYLGFLADLYSYFKKYDDARITYNKILTIDPTYESVYYSLATLDYHRNDTVSFKSNYIKAVSSPNIELDQKIQKFIPFLIEDNKESLFFSENELIFIFQKIIALHPFESQGYVLFGNYLRTKKNNDSALQQFIIAIDLEPTNEQLWQDILFLNVEMQDYPSLLSNGKKALSYFPQNGLITLLYASGLLQENSPFEAVKSINHVIPFSDANPALKGQLYALLGDASYKAGLSDSAFVAYEEALKLNDKNLGVLNNYSYYLSLENRDLDKAEKMSSRTIELEPGNSTFLDTYAWVLFQKKRYLEAKFIIERAIDNGGEVNFEIVEHYGDILFFNDDIQHALIQWNKALLLLQDEKNLNQDKNRIEKLIQKIETKTFIK